MVLKILLLLIILIAAVISIFRYKTIEPFYFITSEEIQKNAKNFSNATDLYNQTLSTRDALKMTLVNLQNQAEINQEEISKNQADLSPSLIENSLSVSDKINIKREQDKITKCKDDIQRSVGDYNKSKKDFEDISTIYNKANDSYQEKINNIEQMKKTISDLRNKMNTCQLN